MTEHFKRHGARFDPATKEWRLPLPASDEQLVALDGFLNAGAWQALQPDAPGADSGTDPNQARKGLPHAWLGYYQEVLRFDDLDNLHVRPSDRAQIFGRKGVTVADVLAGRIPMAPNGRRAATFWAKLHDAQPHDATAQRSAGDERLQAWALFGFYETYDNGQVAVALPLRVAWAADGQALICSAPAQPLTRPLIIHASHLLQPSAGAEPRYPVLGTTSEPVGETDTTAGPDTIDWQTYVQRVNADWQAHTEAIEPFCDEPPSRSLVCRRLDRFAHSAPLTFMGLAAPGGDRAMTRGLRHLLAAATQRPKLPPVIAAMLNDNAPAFTALDTLAQFHASATLARFLGHFSADFPLDPAQRAVIVNTAVGKQCLFGVSGPPGTGKTAVLRSFIANAVVMGAIAKSPRPPLIAAISGTNQATTNIISAFDMGDDAYNNTGALHKRWIPGLPSLGWFLPAKSRMNDPDYAGFQLLAKAFGSQAGLSCHGRASAFGSPVEPQHVAALREAYDANLAQYAGLPADTALDPKQRVRLIRQLRDGVIARAREIQRVGALTERLTQHLAACPPEALSGYRHHRERLHPRTYPSIPGLSAAESDVAERQSDIDRLSAAIATVQQAHERPRTWWRMLASLFGHRAARARELARLRALLAHHDPAPADANLTSVLDHAYRVLHQMTRDLRSARTRLERLQARVSRREQRIARAQAERRRLGEQLAPGRQVWETLRTLQHALAQLAQAPGQQRALSDSTRTPDAGARVRLRDAMARITATVLRHNDATLEIPALLQDVESILDLTARHSAFHLAMRYWEGRWIMAVQEPMGTQERLTKSLSRLAMLAPITVATAFSAHHLTSHFDPGTGSLNYELGLLDWIIVDEAGQVPPSVGMPPMGLARQALIVGDVEQIAPVVKLPPNVDQQFLRRHGLPETTPHHRARSEPTGSLMAMALAASGTHATPSAGLMLVYHYRCRRSIIEFCNELVYSRIAALHPVIPDAEPCPAVWRDPSTHTTHLRSPQAQAFLPPMAFVPVDGEEQRGGGVSNPHEIQAIVHWLSIYRVPIEAAYNRPIEEVVSIVTPFRQQVDELKRAVSEQGIRVQSATDNARGHTGTFMTIGTVFALQGSERAIVVFSATSTDPGRTGFIDASTSMLNVAVSRAQHSFVLFASPAVLFRDGRGPLSVLGAYMRRRGYRLWPRDLVVAEGASKARALAEAIGPLAQPAATNGTFRTLDWQPGDPAPTELHWTDMAQARTLTKAIRQHTRDGVRHYDHILLATDDDLAGELIAWHVIQLIEAMNIEVTKGAVRRVRFYAVERTHLRDAVHRARPGLDANRVRAALAREVLNKALVQQGVGRHKAALLDKLPELGAAQHLRLAHLEGIREPFVATEQALPFAGPADPDGSTAPAIDDDTVVQVSAPHTLVLKEPPLPPPNTAEVMAAVLRSRNDISPAEIMEALESLYLGRPQEKA